MGWEIPTKLIYKEPLPKSYLDTVKLLNSKETKTAFLGGKLWEDVRIAAYTESESRCDVCYMFLGDLATQIHGVGTEFFASGQSVEDSITGLIGVIIGWESDYRFFLEDTQGDNPHSKRLCSEYDLMLSYGFLEVLQLIARFTLTLNGIACKKSHPLHSQTPKHVVERLSKCTRDCYDAIMAVARSDVEGLKKHGLARMRTYAREGPTGTAFRDILTDRDIDFYAKEYVESAVEAYSGILKVKLN